MNLLKKAETFVTTYFSGIVDENDLCFLGGFPGTLREVTELIDSLYDVEVNHIEFTSNNVENLKGTYEVKDYCDLTMQKQQKFLQCIKMTFMLICQQ